MRVARILVLPVFFSILFVTVHTDAISEILGPLRVNSANPRYFTDPKGRVVYLTGSHVWDNLQDWGGTTPKFDYLRYLEFLKRNDHNFVRLWKIGESTGKRNRAGIFIEPMPWERKGPGTANDGKPKFDLNRFDQEYFDRLRFRVMEAGKRGIYVSVMLFDGIYDGITHPFNNANNINGLDGRFGKDGLGKEVHTLNISKVVRFQEAYIRKVIDTVNDLGNVLYEVGNEIQGHSIQWQYHMIGFIHRYERGKPLQHPVGMTSSGGPGPEHLRNSDLFNSPADWISPRAEPGENYGYDPPAASGRKVILADTDHLGGVLEDPSPQWVWKSFLRGINPILMDVIQNRAPGHAERWNDPDRPALEATRRAMGQTLEYSKRINLATMVPHARLASTRYCLADPGNEYLMYFPSEGRRARAWELIGLGRKKVDLTGAPSTFYSEWLDVKTGKTAQAKEIEGGTLQTLRSHFKGDVVLYLRRKN